MEARKETAQGWVAVQWHKHPAETDTAAAKLLARRYGGDLGSAHAQHVGRVPGLRNRKGQYFTPGRYPLCRLVRAAGGPKGGGGGGCLLKESAGTNAPPPPPPPPTPGGLGS